MTDGPNPEDFSVNEREKEYEITLEVTGKVRMTVSADSLEDAEKDAGETASQIEIGAIAIDLDCIDDASVYHVHKTPRMYRVIRDGQTMQVSLLNAGDLPREPNDAGF